MSNVAILKHTPRAAQTYRFFLRQTRGFTGPGKHEVSRLVEYALMQLGHFAAEFACLTKAHAKLRVGMMRHKRTWTQGGIDGGAGPAAGSLEDGLAEFYELLALWVRGVHDAGCSDSSSMLESGEWAPHTAWC